MTTTRRRRRRNGGRPRKPGARKPSGDLRLAPDEGSPLLLAHRALAIDPTPPTQQVPIVRAARGLLG